MHQNDIFLSYSREDEQVMRFVHRYLEDQGFTVWVDQKDIPPGTSSWQVNIENGITNSGCVVVMLSPDTQKSRWVREELNYAELKKKQIFPILVRGNLADVALLGFTAAQHVDIRESYSPGLDKLVVEIRRHLGATAAPSVMLSPLSASRVNPLISSTPSGALNLPASTPESSHTLAANTPQSKAPEASPPLQTASTPVPSPAPKSTVNPTPLSAPPVRPQAPLPTPLVRPTISSVAPPYYGTSSFERRIKNSIDHYLKYVFIGAILLFVFLLILSSVVNRPVFSPGTTSSREEDGLVNYSQGSLTLVSVATNPNKFETINIVPVRAYPPGGWVYYGVELRFECVVQKCISPPEARLLVRDTNRAEYEQKTTVAVMGGRAFTNMTEGDVAVGWVVFEVPNTAKVDQLIIYPRDDYVQSSPVLTIDLP